VAQLIPRAVRFLVTVPTFVATDSTALNVPFEVGANSIVAWAYSPGGIMSLSNGVLTEKNSEPVREVFVISRFPDPVGAVLYNLIVDVDGIGTGLLRLRFEGYV
jgi:hypothetical protein